jgi:hypothetical protein
MQARKGLSNLLLCCYVEQLCQIAPEERGVLAIAAGSDGMMTAVEAAQEKHKAAREAAAKADRQRTGSPGPDAFLPGAQAWSRKRTTSTTVHNTSGDSDKWNTNETPDTFCNTTAALYVGRCSFGGSRFAALNGGMLVEAQCVLLS